MCKILTDQELENSLIACANSTCDCPYNEHCVNGECSELLIEQAVEYINRLKAKIGELETNNKSKGSMTTQAETQQDKQKGYYYLIAFYVENHLGSIMLRTRLKIDNVREYKKLEGTVRRETNLEGGVILNIQYLGEVEDET